MNYPWRSMRTFSRRLTALLLAAGLYSGCAHTSSPTAVLERAATAAAKKGHHPEARTLAFAGFHAWLVAGDPAAARARFGEALVEDPTEPFALHGQHLLARRVANPRAALEAALALTARAPR
ncbi:MAG TPA: hypothetical protein VLQ93_21955, partial [Myxococcaceae bacterium]|nr:hypothetical protein [Myxococcaceae bacterium]